MNEIWEDVKALCEKHGYNNVDYYLTVYDIHYNQPEPSEEFKKENERIGDLLFGKD